MIKNVKNTPRYFLVVSLVLILAVAMGLAAERRRKQALKEQYLQSQTTQEEKSATSSSKLINPFTDKELEINPDMKGIELLPVMVSDPGSEVITVTDLSTTLKEGEEGYIEWRVDSDLNVEEAKVLYGLNRVEVQDNDLPEDVNYGSESQAEKLGNNTFRATFSFAEGGIRFVRLYVKTGERDLWGDEIGIDVIPKDVIPVGL